MPLARLIPAALVVALLAAGCGTGGEQEPVAGYQPVSGNGPYHRIAADSPLAPQGAPFVIDDPRENLDEPSLIVRDDGGLSPAGDVGHLPADEETNFATA